MKLHADHLEGLNAISGYTPESVTINGTTWRGSVIVPCRGDVSAWACPEPGNLQPEHFEQIAALAPELVIFGSGPVLRFPPAAALRALMARRIGVESMDTRAACRTWSGFRMNPPRGDAARSGDYCGGARGLM